MKILFITSRLPFPPRGGDKLRVFNFIKLLSEKYQIYLLSFIESSEENKYVEDLRKICKDVETVLLPPVKSYLNCIFYFFSKNPLQLSYYRSAKMYSRIKLFIEKYRIDSIYAHLIRMAPYAKDLSIFKVLDLTDAICLTLERSLRYRKHIFYLFYFQEWLKVRKYEKNIVKQFDKCLLITDIEKNAIEDAKGLMNIEIIQNGVDIEKLKPSDKPYNEKKITFVGNLHSFPNRDAVLFFYNEILPLVKKQVPDIKFYIIGINPPPKILKLNEDENVVVTGPVENLKYYLDNSACFVCPIRSGAGLQNKILEAMALGLPVVTTSIGFEGIKARENEDILIADSPEEFAKKILKIIKNEKLRTRLSKNARATMEENYSWHKIKDKLEKVFKKKQNS